MAEFDVAVAFQLLTDKVGDTESAVKGLTNVKPLWKPLGNTNTPSASPTQLVALPNGPAAGRMWFIHRAGVFGADGHTSVAGLADVYAGPGQEADITAQIYSGLTIPTIIVEGMNTNPVLPNERVYALFYNLPANQQVAFAVLVEEYPLEATTGTRI